MIIKRILAMFGNKKAKSFLYNHFKDRLSSAIVAETKAMHEYQSVFSSDASKTAKLAEEYFLSKWAREELEKKVKQYA